MNFSILLINLYILFSKLGSVVCPWDSLSDYFYFLCDIWGYCSLLDISNNIPGTFRVTYQGEKAYLWTNFSGSIVFFHSF